MWGSWSTRKSQLDCPVSCHKATTKANIKSFVHSQGVRWIEALRTDPDLVFGKQASTVRRGEATPRRHHIQVCTCAGSLQPSLQLHLGTGTTRPAPYTPYRPGPHKDTVGRAKDKSTERPWLYLRNQRPAFKISRKRFNQVTQNGHQAMLYLPQQREQCQDRSRLAQKQRSQFSRSVGKLICASIAENAAMVYYTCQ